jgi:hypothetical protein
MPGALTHTKITWALSPTAPQILGVSLGSPPVPMGFWALCVERCVIQPLLRDKLGTVRALLKVLEAYVGEAILPTDPTRCILGNYDSGYHDVVLATMIRVITMINLRVNFHGWKSTSNHWPLIKGIELNAREIKFGEQTMNVDVYNIGS